MPTRKGPRLLLEEEVCSSSALVNRSLRLGKTHCCFCIWLISGASSWWRILSKVKIRLEHSRRRLTLYWAICGSAGKPAACQVIRRMVLMQWRQICHRTGFDIRRWKSYSIVSWRSVRKSGINLVYARYVGSDARLSTFGRWSVADLFGDWLPHF